MTEKQFEKLSKAIARSYALSELEDDCKELLGFVPKEVEAEIEKAYGEIARLFEAHVSEEGAE